MHSCLPAVADATRAAVSPDGETPAGTVVLTGTVDTNGFFAGALTATAGYHALQISDGTGRGAVAARAVGAQMIGWMWWMWCLFSLTP